MNRESDPLLEDLFAAAPQLEEPFPLLEHIEKAITRSQRVRRLGLFSAELLVLITAWLISEPLTSLANEFMPWIMGTLIDTGESQIATLLAPLNSVAGVLAFCVLFMGAVYRRLLRR